MTNRPKILLPLFSGIALAFTLLISFHVIATDDIAYADPKRKSVRAASPNPNLSVGHTTIPGSPLTIHVAEDASYQVEYEGLSQVYPPLFDEADSGIFVWYTEGEREYVIGPDFNKHSTSAANLYDPWSSVSQNGLMGTGTSIDPWRVETAVRYVTDTLTLDMTTITTYVDGEDSFSIAWEICLPDPAEISTFLAADLSTDGDDKGYGYYDPGSGSVGGTNQAQDWFQAFTPLTTGSHYYEDDFLNVWNAIGQAGLQGQGFIDEINQDLVPNGAGLQWDLSVSGCTIVRAVWGFSGTTSPTDTPTPTATTTPTPTPTFTSSPPPPPLENPIYLPAITG